MKSVKRFIEIKDLAIRESDSILNRIHQEVIKRHDNEKPTLDYEDDIFELGMLCEQPRTVNYCVRPTDSDMFRHCQANINISFRLNNANDTILFIDLVINYESQFDDANRMLKNGLLKQYGNSALSIQSQEELRIELSILSLSNSLNYQSIAKRIIKEAEYLQDLITRFEMNFPTVACMEEEVDIVDDSCDDLED